MFSNTAEQASTGEHKKMSTRVSPCPSGEPNDPLSTLTRQFAKRVKRERDEQSPLTPEATVLLEVFPSRWLYLDVCQTGGKDPEGWHR